MNERMLLCYPETQNKWALKYSKNSFDSFFGQNVAVRLGIIKVNFSEKSWSIKK